MASAVEMRDNKNIPQPRPKLESCVSSMFQPDTLKPGPYPTHCAGFLEEAATSSCSCFKLLPVYVNAEHRDTSIRAKVPRFL